MSVRQRRDCIAYRDGVPMRSAAARALEREAELAPPYFDWQQPLARCTACGRFFTSHPSRVCLECRKKEG